MRYSAALALAATLLALTPSTLALSNNLHQHHPSKPNQGASNQGRGGNPFTPFNPFQQHPPHPSASARYGKSKKRRTTEAEVTGEEGRERGMDSEALCGQGLSVCAVPNAGKGVWECVDTSADLWSCGGCTVPFDLSTAPAGEDCTAIAHANAVACHAGTCAVSTCEAGYTPSADGRGCVKEEEDEENVLLAGLEYGLEHILHLAN